jgi:hypothetical protein
MGQVSLVSKDLYKGVHGAGDRGAQVADALRRLAGNEIGNQTFAFSRCGRHECRRIAPRVVLPDEGGRGQAGAPPKTMVSRSELPPRRLAPCTETQAHSPAAYDPVSDVAPSVSLSISPIE